MMLKLLLAAILAALVSPLPALSQGTPSRSQGYIAPEYQQSWNDYLSMKARAQPPRLANWSGIWQRSGMMPLRGGWGLEAEVVPGAPPGTSLFNRLTPKYKAAFEKKIAFSDRGIEFDRLSACLPAGMPRWLAEPFMREFIVTPDVTWLIHEQLTEIRRIYTDGKQHSAKDEVPSLYEGESIGFWDGDTLVIHTIHMKAGEYQRRLPDYSFKVSTVERMHAIDANDIETEVTVYDPDSLTKPFKSKFTYRKITGQPNLRIDLASCEAGNNAVMTPEGGTTFVLPGEPGYHDPTTFGIPEVALDSMPE